MPRVSFYTELLFTSNRFSDHLSTFKQKTISKCLEVCENG